MSELQLGQSVSTQQKQTQKQRLIVSQKHQQAIKLLQYPKQRIEQWLTSKIQENPLLEMRREEHEEDEFSEEDLEETEIEEEIDWEDLINPGDDVQLSFTGSGRGSSSEDSLRALAEEHETLQDFLTRQLQLQELTERDEKLSQLLISHLDADGYFTGDLEQIAAEREVDREELEELLRLIQRLEPPGVGGRNLEEVLLLQLRQLEEEIPPKSDVVIEEHLEDLEKRSYKKISSAVGIEPEQVQQIADLVRELEPRPGRRFEILSRQYLEPDVYVRKVNGKLTVILNEGGLPPLRINARYRSMLESEDPELVEYVKEKLSGALWIINCIYQRQQTLYKVVYEIFERQDDFFTEGEKGIKPLVMQEVADAVELHESTVSRAVRDKYVQTPRGLYELGFFFAPALKTTNGGEVSAVAVRAMLKEIVENEDKTNPLNDREIKEKLAEEGVEIGRRTVSKYRKQMQIPKRKLRQRVTYN